MAAWEVIQDALDAIDRNLPEEIGIETLAAGASLSPFYFQRLFRKLVKKPVNEYIKLRRLETASKALIESRLKITDIAFSFGFSSHANFTRAFTDVYGISPEEYQRYQFPLNHFIKPDLRSAHTAITEGEPFITDGIAVEITRRNLEEPRYFSGFEFALPEGELDDGRTVGVSMAGQLWQQFHQQKQLIPGLLPNGCEIGVLLGENAPTACCKYLLASETIKENIAKGFAGFVLPAGEYIICRVEAEKFSDLIETAVHKAADFTRHWMKQQRLGCGAFAAEIYPAVTREECSMELWLPLVSQPTANPLRWENKWDKHNHWLKPSMETIDAYVSSDLWIELRTLLETDYQSSPLIEFSKCSAQHGWNIKYKKSGRSLCTLYPLAGYFIALVVIGTRERVEFEMKLPTFSDYLQDLYRNTNGGMDQKWLMIEVRNAAVLEDVKRCLAIRGRKKDREGK